MGHGCILTAETHWLVYILKIPEILCSIIWHTLFTHQSGFTFKSCSPGWFAPKHCSFISQINLSLGISLIITKHLSFKSKQFQMKNNALQLCILRQFTYMIEYMSAKEKTAGQVNTQLYLTGTPSQMCLFHSHKTTGHQPISGLR